MCECVVRSTCDGPPPARSMVRVRGGLALRERCGGGPRRHSRGEGRPPQQWRNGADGNRAGMSGNALPSAERGRLQHCRSRSQRAAPAQLLRRQALPAMLRRHPMLQPQRPLVAASAAGGCERRKRPRRRRAAAAGGAVSTQARRYAMAPILRLPASRTQRPLGDLTGGDGGGAPAGIICGARQAQLRVGRSGFRWSPAAGKLDGIRLPVCQRPPPAGAPQEPIMGIRDVGREARA